MKKKPGLLEIRGDDGTLWISITNIVNKSHETNLFARVYKLQGKYNSINTMLSLPKDAYNYIFSRMTMAWDILILTINVHIFKNQGHSF